MDPGMISYRRNDINVDGGVAYARYHFRYPCMICAICLETLEEIYPWELEERMDMVLKDCGLPDDAKELAENYRENHLKKVLTHREDILKRLGKK